MKTGKIVAGTRGSRLALIQTDRIISLLRQANPGLEIEVKAIVTSGDRDRHSHIEQMGVDVFVKELEESLLDRRIDIAVHSLKDMPTELPSGLHLAAVPERENPADVLAEARGTLDALPAGAKIGTGSLRRVAQLMRHRPDILPCPVRGNIETRLRKAADGELDGVILAAAALIRLGLQERITEYLPMDVFLPAAGQGALGIESRCDDDDITRLVSAINHPASWACVVAERSFLKAIGGGCRAPIGVLGRITGEVLHLEAMISSPDGRESLYRSMENDSLSPEELGVRLARKLLEAGAGRLLPEDGQV